MTFTARDLFEAERQGKGPSAEARARVRAKLVQRLGASAAVAAAATSAATPAAAGGGVLTGVIGKTIALCVLGGTIISAGYVATHKPSLESRPVAAVAAGRSTPPVAPIAAPAPAAVAPSEVTPPAQPVAPSSPELVAMPAVARRAPVVAAPARGGGAIPAREESAAAEPAALAPPAPESVPDNPAPAAAAPADGLQAELALVRAAHDSLRAGKPDVALERMEQHRREFPNGALAEERDALRVSAICALGRPDAASEAQTFLANHPGSPFVGRIRDACPH